MKSRSIKLYFVIFMVCIVTALAIIPAGAYDIDWYVEMFDGTTKHSRGASTVGNVVGTSSPETYSMEIDNSDPVLFEQNKIYTFDVILYFKYPHSNTFSGLMQNCVNYLSTYGFTTEWYINYVFNTSNITATYHDGTGKVHDFVLGGTGTGDQQFYVSQDECVVAYNDTVYNGSQSDLLHFYSGMYLQIQQKIHFQFSTPDVMNSLELYWDLYNFGTTASSQTSNYYADFGLSDMTVLDNGLNQVQINILGSIANVSSQVTALQSTMDQLLEQNDYYLDLMTADWDQALNEFESYDDSITGILPQLYIYLWNIEDSTYTILMDVRSIKSSTSVISSNTTTLVNLLNNRNNNFWKWLDSNFSTIHNDLIETNDYLDQIVTEFGVNDNVTKGHMMEVSSQIASNEESLTTITDTFVTVDEDTYSTVANYLDTLTYMSGDYLNAGWDIFNVTFSGFNFTIGTLGILSAFVLYALVIKIWGQLFFDE